MKTSIAALMVVSVICIATATCWAAEPAAQGQTTLNIYVVWKQAHNPVPEDIYDIVVTPQPQGKGYQETVGEIGFAEIKVDTEGVEKFTITITHEQTSATGTQTVDCPAAGSTEQIPVFIG